MARDAIYFLIPIAAAVVVAFWTGWQTPGAALFGLGVFVAWFFRDPRRSIPSEPGIIVSPADGRVVRIVREGD
jgi:phosphatidylserine decarboxylase